MKYIKSLLLIVILFMFVSVLNVDAAGVSIKSINSIDTKGNVSEVNEPKINGLNINFDLSFSNKDDSITYEVVLSNPTNKEYEINTDKKFGPSNYISYSYELKDKTNRIKANSEVTLYITIKYENPVPADKLIDGKYIENNDMDINLLNENNPNTSNNIILLVLILLGVIGFTFLNKYIKNKELLIIFIMLLLVPITVFALEKLKLTVSTKITVEEKFNVYYVFSGLQFMVDPDNLGNIYDYNRESCKQTKYDAGNGSYDNCLICRDILIKDKKSYAVGDRVNINTITLEMFPNNNCTYDNDTEIYTCSTFDSYDVSMISYGCMRSSGSSQSEYESVACLDSDLDVMNFDSIQVNEWNDYKHLSLYIPNSFTMPNHSVMFMTSLGR